MDRREAVRKLTLVMGGVLSVPTLSVLLKSCDSNSFNLGSGIDFTAQEKEMIASMAEIIIPRTDTPGAIDTKVPEFVVMMMQDTYPLETQDAFHNGLAAFDSYCKKNLGKDFLALDSTDKTEAVRQLDELVLGKEESKPQDLEFYRIFKELTLFGFFTSESGSTETLTYLQIPGDYVGCTPYKEGDKAWAYAGTGFGLSR